MDCKLENELEGHPEGPSNAPQVQQPLPEAEAAGVDCVWDPEGLMLAGQKHCLLLEGEHGDRKFGFLLKFVGEGILVLDARYHVIGAACLIKEGSVIRKEAVTTEEATFVSVGNGAITGTIAGCVKLVPENLPWNPPGGNQNVQQRGKVVDPEVTLEVIQ